MPRLAQLLVALACLIAPALARAAPLLATPFQNGAVLQRDMPIPLWGHARPGAKLRVTLASVVTTAQAGADGRWTATLPAQAAGGPYTLTASADDGTAQTLSDILIGDVLLCSGQSNMQLNVTHIVMPETELRKRPDPLLRLLQVPPTGAARPAEALAAGARWVTAGPDTIPSFSAVCLLVGRGVRNAKQVPVGLINASLGGTTIEDWLSRPALASTGLHADELAWFDRYLQHPIEGQRELRDRDDQWWATKAAAPARWQTPDFDDSGWDSVNLPRRWQNAGKEPLRDFEGTLWLRQTITLSSAQAAGAGHLRLGRVGEIDSTYVNGAWVGSDDGDVERDYLIPRGVLRPGRNVIAMRLTGTGYGGAGIAPPPGGAVLATDDGFVPLGAVWRYHIVVSLAETGTPPRAPWTPGRGLTTLFNGMIAPLAPYAVKAVVWYQGEQNSYAPASYGKMLAALFSDWRAHFRPDLPYIVVQLPGYRAYADKPGASDWAALREQQRRTVASDPLAGLAVTIDLGEVRDVHPRNKQDVADRVVNELRRVAYRDPAIPVSPAPLAARRVGDTVTVAFAGAESGLITFGASSPVGFELCDGARLCRFVDAQVRGSEVVLAVPKDFTPAFVRFEWADSPIVNLYNRARLPAVPFELALP